MAENESAGRRLRLRDSSLEWREVEGEVVALDLQGSVYLRANSSGALLWHQLARGATEDELAERLVTRYGLPPDQARADVRAFVTDLASHSLLAP